MLGTPYSGSGYGYTQPPPPPGGIFPCDPYAYAWDQQQAWQNIYAANSFAIAPQITQPPIQGEIEHKAKECKEFAWLRGRIKEILWK